MSTGDLLLAVFLLGLPLLAMSWFLFSLLYASGEIDRTADRKSIAARMKQIKKSNTRQERKKRNFLFNKWMWFGSGFYGLAGLYTFFVIEIRQFFGFIFYYPGTDVLMADGFMGFLFNLLLNQIENIVEAFIWFSYWPADSVLLWVLVAYLGYWVGVELARSQRHLMLERYLGRLSFLDAARRRLARLLRRVDAPADQD